MGKEASTVDQQIDKLERRGLVIDLPKDKVKEILLDIGYYRLGFYWHPFQNKDSHTFTRKVTFSEIVELYYFNVDLRYLLLKYLNRIEINFRTKLIYTSSNRHKDNPLWFADRSVMRQAFLDNLDKYYSPAFKKQNKVIKKHHEKHLNDRYAPAWKTLEFFSFGTILMIYKNLKEQHLKQEIAEVYKVRNTKAFENHFEAMLLIRNICAHGGVLYDINLPKGIRNIPALKIYGQDRHTLNSFNVLLKYY
jgi:abortive infection bacteriophage resistance protein